MAFGSFNHSAPRPRAAGTYVPNPNVARLWSDFKAQIAALGLTEDQARFAEAFFTGRNVLLAGKAGTGKSYVLKALFDYLTKSRVSVARTATTGVAAFGIGGQTIHSWAGLGLADEHVESLIEAIKKKGKVKARIRAAQVLFLDEVSMAKADLLDKLDGVLRYFRDSPDPFGGIQVVLSGDWLQLAPVFKGDEVQAFAFHSEVWAAANIKTVLLKKVVRQQDDDPLLTVLNDVRVGDTSSLHLLNARVGATWTDSEIEPVRIFCRNVDVDAFNRERLARVTGAAKTYVARDSGEAYHTDAFNKNCPAPQTLELKVGAQVLLCTNIDVAQGLCNGSVGVVKAFGPSGVTVKFKHGSTLVELAEWSIKEQVAGLDGKIIYRTVATRRQIPLRVCYALTVHRVQGMTLDRAIVDLDEAFATGQTYTALSRVRDLESLSLASAIPHSAIRVNPECVAFYDEAERAEKPF